MRGDTCHDCKNQTMDPQEILAMNAELSRTARELRSEMTKMWSFRGILKICR